MRYPALSIRNFYNLLLCMLHVRIQFFTLTGIALEWLIEAVKPVRFFVLLYYTDLVKTLHKNAATIYNHTVAAVCLIEDKLIITQKLDSEYQVRIAGNVVIVVRAIRKTRW